MAAVKTPMSISALLNPQQQNADINTRQHLDLPLRQMQLDDTNTIHYKQADYRQQTSKRIHYTSSEGHRSPTITDDTKNQLQQQGSTGYRYERFASVSSTSSTTISERRRAPRPKYTDEEMYFIWYHRVDLDEEWRDCTEAFNKQFPGQGRSERNTQGIQCKFYRFINAKKCPTVREQRRLKDGEFMVRGRSTRGRLLPKFGVVEWCQVWYPWMRAEHAIAGLHPGPQLHPIEPLQQNQSISKTSDDEQMMRTYSQSSISSSAASVLSSEASTPEPYTPSSYSDDIVSEEEIVA
ncbi:hypothetical protein TMatcc_005688 [Talaromyces marneffei ATCC 18224]|uniref:Uncharacterized protein n=2 Tax=Talaromyces marneffei TaxID=37727 RepID=B6Q9B5_TALMQ|nr:uncharacterized protein EYB26_005795 [Talaromyces marneffei]EEA26060.1 conserved hypothetical protein [Talaromyces marneffei ATCC 18224]KAE8554774.1 hypothetical protein EYB25_003318 [Talaromyces marneffei]QGA18114.1 hypothetical protein EYB26_005795 [Talaromyces marneffei]